jgi:hypothetical protein
MRFPRPYFELLRQHFRTDPASAHLGSAGRLGGAPQAPETSAARMSEALVLAVGLVADRASILRSEAAPGDDSPLLGRYGYRTNLCPHGLARGVADLAYFLQEHWGQPLSFERLEEPPRAIVDTTGLIAFLNIDGVREQGHADVWDRSRCLGAAYWPARKILYWKLA